MVSPALVARWLPVTAQKIVPWRNGSGSTREVAIEPPSASVATGFVWRVSIAGVAADGPFSSFPGIDRSLWLLRGAGMELTIDGDSTRLVRPLQRIDFAGEASVQARLLGGPTEDLNVMVARSAAVGSAAVCELAVGEVLAVELPAAQHLLLVLSGAIALAGGTAGPGDAVRLDGAGPLRATASAACTLLRASFTLRQPAVDGR
jgi:environmental stress-induced protein Ves